MSLECRKENRVFSARFPGAWNLERGPPSARHGACPSPGPLPPAPCLNAEVGACGAPPPPPPPRQPACQGVEGVLGFTENQTPSSCRYGRAERVLCPSAQPDTLVWLARRCQPFASPPTSVLFSSGNVSARSNPQVGGNWGKKGAHRTRRRWVS